MIEIPLDKIGPNRNQPRKHFEGLEELASSLKEHGQLTPALVRPVEGGFELVHGERRWRAAKLAGLETLRAEVREMTGDDAVRLSLVENVHRADLTPIEEAEAYQVLADGGMTQAAIGELVGKSQQYVADRLALLRLPDQVQDLVTARAVSPSVARRLVAVDDKGLQIELAERAADDGLTVKALEDIKRSRLIWNGELPLPADADDVLAVIQWAKQRKAWLATASFPTFRQETNEHVFVNLCLERAAGATLNRIEKKYGRRCFRVMCEHAGKFVLLCAAMLSNVREAYTDDGELYGKTNLHDALVDPWAARVLEKAGWLRKTPEGTEVLQAPTNSLEVTNLMLDLYGVLQVVSLVGGA